MLVHDVRVPALCEQVREILLPAVSPHHPVNPRHWGGDGARDPLLHGRSSGGGEAAWRAQRRRGGNARHVVDFPVLSGGLRGCLL